MIKKLTNGMTVYFREEDVPFAMAELVLPIGHFHTTGEIPKGAVHLLEHFVSGRSEKFPTKNELIQRIELEGGEYRAHTNVTHTGYDLSASTELFNTTFKGFIEHIYNPLFLTDDIAFEKSIIKSERSGKEK